MKVTVFYEIRNKRLNERSKHQKTINYTEKYSLCGDDFEYIKKKVRAAARCGYDDVCIVRKIRVGRDEYMGCW